MASGSRSNNLRREIAAQKRAAEQAARQQARDQALAYEQSRKDQASQMTAAASARVNELTGILASSLASPPPRVSSDRLKRTPVKVPLELGSDAHAVPPPRWQDFEPSKLGTVSRLFGGEARYTRDREAAERAFAAEGDRHPGPPSIRALLQSSARRPWSADSWAQTNRMRNWFSACPVIHYRYRLPCRSTADAT